MVAYIDVKPEIIRWAIDRSGKRLEEFQPAVAAWLSGEQRPTYARLRDFADRAMVPFGYLFLDAPPDEVLPVPDYRSRQSAGVQRPSPNLIETIYEMQRRQEWMREYLTELGHEPLSYVGSAKLGDAIEPLAQRIRATLGLGDGWAQSVSTWEEAIRHLRSRIEDVGILIFISGVVGTNTHRKLDPEEFQGFVLADDVAPLIFVNNADYKVAQMFTIAHELSHVWLGKSALFDLPDLESPNTAIEQFCNRVAAEFLVPAERLIEAWPQRTDNDAVFSELARTFKVSPIVVARRAKDLRLIGRERFFAFYREYVAREQRKQSSGGNFWLTQNVRLGARFGEAVIAAVQEGRLSYSDAYELTGLHGSTFDAWVEKLRETRR